MRDIEFSDNLTGMEAILIMIDRCRKDYFGRGLYKGEEYYLCGGDCQACSVREVLRLLFEIIKAGNGKDKIRKEIKDWRLVSISKETPKRPGETFEDGWRLGINRVCNSIEMIID